MKSVKGENDETYLFRFPRGEAWEPAIDIFFVKQVIIAETFYKAGLFNQNKVNRINEPENDEPNQNRKRAEKNGLAQQNRKNGKNHRISNVAIRAGYYKMFRGRPWSRRAIADGKKKRNGFDGEKNTNEKEKQAGRQEYPSYWKLEPAKEMNRPSQVKNNGRNQDQHGTRQNDNASY